MVNSYTINTPFFKVAVDCYEKVRVWYLISYKQQESSKTSLRLRINSRMSVAAVDKFKLVSDDGADAKLGNACV